MANDQSVTSEVTLGVYGAQKVGKSALIVRLLTKRFIGEYDSSSISTYNSEMKNEGDILKFQVLDHPGDFDDFNTTCMASIDCCVVVYAIDDTNSFNHAINLIHRIFQSREPSDIITLLLGNKRDLVGTRKVATDEAQVIATNLGCIFYEVSAAEDFHNVHSVFKDLLLHVRRLKATEKRNRKLSTKQRAARLFSFGGRTRSGTL